MLDREVAARRTAGQDGTLIAAFEEGKRQDIRERAIVETVKIMEEEAEKREETEKEQTAIVKKETENRLQIENTIAKRSQQRTRTRLDDMTEQFRQEEELLKEKGLTGDQLDRLRLANTQALHRAETEETEKALKEQSKDYERFVKDVQQTTGRFIFDVLSGRIQSFKDLLGTVKDSFLKLLSDMAAAALARPIALALTTTAGNLGLNALLGMPEAAGATTGILGATGAIGGFLRTPIGPGFTSGAPPVGTQGPLLPSGAFYSGSSTIGQTLGAGAAGVGLGQVGSQLLAPQNKGSTIGSTVGGIGGAAIGTAIMPGLGTFLGGLVGSIAGGLIGGLLGKPKFPSFQTTGLTAPQVSFLPGQGVTIPQTFDVGLRGRGGQSAQIQERLSTAANTLFGELESTMRQFPLSLQKAATPHLEGMTQDFEKHFRNVRFGGANLAKDLESWVTKALPEAFHATFDPIIESMQKLAPVVAKFDEVISQLEQRQAEILSGIALAQQSIEEATLAPSARFARRMDEMWATLGTFRAGTPAEQMTLAPQLTAQTQDVFAQRLQQFQEEQAVFQQRQGQAMGAIGGARQGIEQALFTPAQLQASHEGTLQTLLAEFRNAADAVRLEMVPQIAGLTQEVFQQFLQQQNQAIQAFQQQQAQVLSTIQGVRDSIEGALLTPAQLAATREQTLQAMLVQFRAGTTAVQMEMAPQIAGLTQEVFNQFLAQHQQAIQAFQQQQQQVLSTIEGARQSISSAMLTPEQLGATREQTFRHSSVNFAPVPPPSKWSWRHRLRA